MQPVCLCLSLSVPHYWLLYFPKAGSKPNQAGFPEKSCFLSSIKKARCYKLGENLWKPLQHWRGRRLKFSMANWKNCRPSFHLLRKVIQGRPSLRWLLVPRMSRPKREINIASGPPWDQKTAQKCSVLIDHPKVVKWISTIFFQFATEKKINAGLSLLTEIICIYVVP